MGYSTAVRMPYLFKHFDAKADEIVDLFSSRPGSDFPKPLNTK